MNRSIIKQRAKEALRFRYWPIVGMELIAGVLMGGSSGISFSYRFNTSGNSDWKQVFQNTPYGKEILSAFLVIGILAAVASMLYMFLFGNAIRVGISSVRLSAYRRQSFRFSDLFSGLKHYGRVIGAMALMTLFVTLGFCCFIVPGIIVACGLFEVPYLLAEDPSLTGMAVIRRSWEDMRGYKGKLFGLELSFFGWFILSALTFGILANFYVGPYVALSEAGFYHERHAEADGQIE